MGPEDALQMDIVPVDDPSGGYTAVITAMDVSSRYLFAFSVARIDTKTVTRVLTDIITRHCYLPTTIITDKGSQFISEAMQQTTAILGIQLKHATTKHAQTIGILERTHARQRKPKNHDGREANDVAPILTNGSIKLQHFLPHIIRLRTQPSFPWKSAIQRTRPKVRS